MKKFFLFILAMVSICCLFAIAVSAADMSNYCSVKITLVDGTEITGYCAIDKSSKRLLRDSIYLTPDKANGTVSWSEIKVFDGRDSVVVGGVDPTEIAGTECSKSASNVIAFYFPPTIKKILNTTFTSGWSSLQDVWVPKSVTAIDHDGFGGSAVSRVIFEEGSALQSIGNDCFKSCVNLASFDFPQSLESIGRNCFYLSGLSGTVVVPNNVTYLGPGAFLSTKIETLILGDGEMTIGYNFAGTFNATNNQYLKNVYISTGATFEYNGSSKIFFKCASPVNFYVVGENSQEFIETLKGQSTGSYITFITEEEVTESTGAGYGIINTDVTRCEAFYGGAHDYAAVAPCLNGCTRCDSTTSGEAPHSYISVDTFTGEKYLSPCTVTKVCGECSASGESIDVGVMITWRGYSVPEFVMPTGTVSISQGFYIDYASVNAYEMETGKTLEYGVVAANGGNDAPIFIDGGNISAQGVSIVVPMSGVDFFEIKIANIPSEKYDAAVVFSGYVYDGKGVYYLNNGKCTAAPIALSYNQLING